MKQRHELEVEQMPLDELKLKQWFVHELNYFTFFSLGLLHDVAPLFATWAVTSETHLSAIMVTQ